MAATPGGSPVPVIAVNLFPPEVNSLDHPPVVQMRRMLLAMAQDYGGTLTSFAVDRGIVLVGVDSEKMAKDLCEFIGETLGRPAETVREGDRFWDQTQAMLDDARRKSTE